MTLEKLKKHCGTYFENFFQSQVKYSTTVEGNVFYSIIAKFDSLKFAVLQIDRKDLHSILKLPFKDLAEFEIKFVCHQNDFYVFKLVDKLDGNGFLELL